MVLGKLSDKSQLGPAHFTRTKFTAAYLELDKPFHFLLGVFVTCVIELCETQLHHVLNFVTLNALRVLSKTLLW